jgi:hypothetical protein
LQEYERKINFGSPEPWGYRRSSNYSYTSIDNKALLAGFEVDLEIVERASGLQFAEDLESDRRKRLCDEVKCDVSVRDFRERIADSKL